MEFGFRRFVNVLVQFSAFLNLSDLKFQTNQKCSKKRTNIAKNLMSKCSVCFTVSQKAIFKPTNRIVWRRLKSRHVIVFSFLTGVAVY